MRGQFWISDPSRVLIARNGRHELTNLMLTAAQVRELVELMPGEPDDSPLPSSPHGEEDRTLDPVRPNWSCSATGHQG